jgi:hypothetical protein
MTLKFALWRKNMTVGDIRSELWKYKLTNEGFIRLLQEAGYIQLGKRGKVKIIKEFDL